MAKQSLKSIQIAKLYNFLQNNIDLTRTETADSVAAKATEALGFPVNGNNVAGLRQQMGITIRQPKGKKLDVQKAIVLLAREICGLKTGLGSVSSAELSALAAGEE